MAVTRRAYAGGAVKTTIPAGISGTPATFDIDDATGWPTGAPFYVVVDPGLAAEEKILGTRSGTTITVTTRGVDGTSSADHGADAEIYPCLTAVDLDEANRLAAIMTTQGDLIVADASGNPARIAIGTSGQILESNGTTAAWGKVGTAGIEDSAVTTAIIADANVTTAKITGRTLGFDRGTADATTTSTSYTSVADFSITPTYVSGRTYEITFDFQLANANAGSVAINIDSTVVQEVAASGTGTPFFLRYVSSSLSGALATIVQIKSQSGSAYGIEGTAASNRASFVVKDIT